MAWIKSNKKQSSGGGGRNFCSLGNHYAIFSDKEGDTCSYSGRNCVRNSSSKVLWFNCKATNGNYYGWGLVGLTSESVQVTATTSYGGGAYFTQQTTNGNTVYTARLGAMSGGNANVVVGDGNGNALNLTSSDIISHNANAETFDQDFIDAAYTMLTS